MSVYKQVTIKQVAQKADVSTQTVSRVLNNRPDVAPETRERVQEIINQLGYKPSAIARSLIRRRSQTIGVVISELGQYGPMRRLLGMDEAATESGYSLHLDLVHQPEMDNGDQILAELLTWHVDGIIWAIPEIGQNRTWLQRKAAQLPVPIAFISEQSIDNGYTVSVDNRSGGFMATRHLLAQGYRHIGIITGPLDWAVAQQRRLGWQEALVSYQNQQTFEGDWSAASGEAGLHHLQQHYREMDAVFVSNDQMALGVLQVAHQLGLRVPEDLGVIGFDNIPEAAYFTPPLTTIRHKLMDQGKIVLQRLIDIIEARR
ncbi:MAG: LacI family DNA-binding transcriptional regulator, partial [Chloroflexi bacterium]|nr:LacI family DNA-binding transcriptional regulator [Chloroflexota bacterium]